MPFNLTTFDAALQAKLNTASVNLSAQDYLLLTKAVAAAIEVSEGISLLDLKNTANGVAGLDANAQIPLAQMTLAVPAQNSHSGKFLTTNGTSTSWAVVDALPSQTGNSGEILTTNGSSASWTDTVTLASISTTGDVTSGDQLYVGSGAAAFETSGTLTSAAAVFKKASAANSYSQIAFQNPTATSSTDIIAYMDNGVDADGWIDMGIAGSTFDDTTYGITAPGDGYIFVNTKTGKTGNLVLATGDNGTENKLVFAAGGFASGNTQMEITPDVNVHIEIPTPSTSATTGALTVVGGVGIQGDMNVNGNVAIQGTITFGGGGTTVETANLAVTDPAVFVGTNNQADTVDLAFIGEYATATSPIIASVNNKALTSNVATLTTVASHTFLAGDVVTITGIDATFNGTYNIIAVPTATTFTYAKTAANVTSAAVSPVGTATVNARRKFAGIARDASDGVLKAFRDATTKPTSTINFSEAGLTYAPFKAGSIEVSSATIGSVTNTEIAYLSGVTSGIQSQISAKANSASPAITGNATFSATSGTAVTITNTGTGNAFVVEDETSTDSSPFVIDASGNIGIGLTTPGQKLDLANNGPIHIRQTRYSTDSTPTYHYLRKSRGTLSSPSVVASGDGIGGTYFNAYDGSTFLDVAQIQAIAEGSVSSGVVPGRISFSTASTTGTLTERLRIDSSGRIQIPAGGILEAPLSTRTVSTTSDTVSITDAGRLIECTNSAATTVTVPLNSSVPYPAGTQINILQAGSGQVTIVGTGGVTINANPGLKLRGQWSSATLIKRSTGTDNWVLVGDITA